MEGAHKALKVGIIGGSGLDDPDILKDRKEHVVKTPFGEPSDALVSGRIGEVDCVLLARHGRKHTVMPSNVNYRANIWALRELGCTHIIATTACGSLREDISPGHIVILDQFIDRTTKRALTFYDGGKDSPKGVCHLSAAAPFHYGLRKVLIDTVRELHIPHHETGTMVTIEGPRFSTRAESCIFRSWHSHVINMTTVPEVILAKEAGLLYAAIALVTDYDCWRLDVPRVDVEQVMETMRQNSCIAERILRTALPKIAAIDWSSQLKEAKDEVTRATMK